MRGSNSRLERNRRMEKLDDTFQALTRHQTGTPHNLEWGQVVVEVNIMTNAGSVATAVALTNVFYRVIRTPRARALLRKEPDAALEPDKVIALDDKAKHPPYLRACLHECPRLFPPTTHGLPRKTSPDGLNVIRPRKQDSP
ncbi:uncharacterized protein NECHADRAFT_86603 [Fusarium vanettenii 77-13-4]|uniref:Cytochrome P450 n=1 Tax=Fusarium vanettenii (strain ATCC MYA-4622 / CBS 123669 / FGSC 9596 / NRRL 45880 / 77-13-4) TaxID=660122 RepID=C7ZHD0_FUSV7|nr:uncharacterized protein NECHADRAFT_86603 [Fusarium vanettenii 77-13-4]EEU36750.1 hypothetical protein NECHADRAFT_86603 [Fusarium vanettenii 77-13-4]